MPGLFLTFLVLVSLLLVAIFFIFLHWNIFAGIICFAGFCLAFVVLAYKIRKGD